MAIKTIETTGHEGMDSISHATEGSTFSFTASHIAAVVYDDTAKNAEIVAALEACVAKLNQVLP